MHEADAALREAVELHEPAVQVLDAAANDDLVGVDVHPSVARQMLGGRMAHGGVSR